MERPTRRYVVAPEYDGDDDDDSYDELSDALLVAENNAGKTGTPFWVTEYDQLGRVLTIEEFDPADGQWVDRQGTKFPKDIR
jgi:hypothetical protein